MLCVLGREVAAAGFDSMGQQEVWASTSGAVESCNIPILTTWVSRGWWGHDNCGDVALRGSGQGGKGLDLGILVVIPNLSDLMIQQDPHLSSWSLECAL